MQLLAYLPASASETAGEILESMREGEQCANDHLHDERRGAARHPYEGWVAVVTPVDPDLQLFSVPTNVCAFLRGRNISKSGIGLIGPAVLEPAVLADFTPLLKLEQLLPAGRLCSVGLASCKSSNLTWINAEVTRTQITSTNLAEVGFRFLKRLQVGCPIHQDAEQLFWKLRDKNLDDRIVAQ